MDTKEAVVTGANGFLGARVVRDLLEGGWTIHALGRDRPDPPWTTSPSPWASSASWP